MTRQCVILVGGLGTRLGALTAETPKPLLPVGGRPFLDVLVEEALRFGFDDILLLAGFRSAQVENYIAALKERHGGRADFRVSVEPAPMGTGGAVLHAWDQLHECFLLLNGDSWFDFNWLDLLSEPGNDESVIAVREVAWADRYESLTTDGTGRVASVHPRGANSAERLTINAGVYVFQKADFAGFTGRFSIEADVLPRLVDEGRLVARRHDGFFIDIGVPESFERAQIEIPSTLQRPALFLDRDGVLNKDHGYVGSVERFEWIAGAKQAIRLANDKGYFVFVVTNQAGVARGFYDESAVTKLHNWMQQELRAIGAHVDDWRYCPFHPEGSVDRYRQLHPWRKPSPGMLLDLMDRWPVRTCESLMIGDQPSDLQAAQAAGLRGVSFDGTNLLNTVREELA